MDVAWYVPATVYVPWVVSILGMFDVVVVPPVRQIDSGAKRLPSYFISELGKAPPTPPVVS